MTDSYNQPTINVGDDPEALEIASYDYRQVESFVPVGTTASIHGLRIPGVLRLKSLRFVSVLAPAIETVTLRLYRIRPSTNPAGFGFILLNTPFVISAGTFPGAGVQLDISSSILPNRCVLPGETLTCSWVQSGPQEMLPLNMNWNLEQISTSEPEPLADIPAEQWPAP